MFKIYNDDCFNVFPKIEKNSIDLVVVDLPYGCTHLQWDKKIDLRKMWEELKKICKYKCVYVFFTTTKYGFEIIDSNKNWFAYDLVWSKPNVSGFLGCNKHPLKKHEMIYVFKNPSSLDDIEIEYNKELRQYSKDLLKYINKSRKEIKKDFCADVCDHFFRFKSSQYSLCIEHTYNKLIELYNIDTWENFKSYEELEKKYEKVPQISPKYNPQKTNGKKYIKQINGVLKENRIYGFANKIDGREIITDRHPTSILKFNYNNDKIHPTQKPVKLCEWLIKTYSNENDIVLDFCMGSGTCYIACKNTNRQFIGIEKDKKIFKIAEERILQL